MTRTSLRETLAQIDRLLAGGQAGSAQAECRYILRVFPKNITAYRLLGRACMELAGYSEAADIFLRLLSSVPDDFTSHLALALIREHEGKLEAAIWHIQRAAEAKPALRVVQAETARLVALRDQPPPSGAPPAGLSRVAQARLYLLGSCYPQALAELQIAESEYPARHDIPVLLAEAYEQASQPEQAVRASRRAIAALPYSLQANRILFIDAMLSDCPEQALPYRQCLQELDPYWAYVTAANLDPQQVPEHAVMLDLEM